MNPGLSSSNCKCPHQMGGDFSVNYHVVVIHFYHSTLLLMLRNGKFKNIAIDLCYRMYKTYIFEYVCVCLHYALEL